MPPNQSRRLAPRTSGSLALVAVAILTSALSANAADGASAIDNATPPAPRPQTCERLATSLTYSQDAAPADVSGILRVVVEKINRDVTGVVDVEVAWSGAELHKRVGERIVRCTVTRLFDSVTSSEPPRRDEVQDPAAAATSTAERRDRDAFGREVVAQCFEVPITVTDVNECTLPKSSAMAHRCHPSSASIGGNHNAANEGGVGRGTCAPNATCRRADSPLMHPDHACVCPEGYLGNGRACVPGMDERPDPKVKYDGVTPTEETKRKLDAGLICGCSLPVVDACSGFPKCPGKHEMCTLSDDNTPECACQPGYVRDDRYGCVDEHPPVLRLNPDPAHTDPETQITHLSQGDKYVEYGVDIRDTNAEEYLRSLKITYSRALPQGCLLEMGEFHVNYTVATPWTTPEFVRAKRTVVIENVDECSVEQGLGVGANCPELVAMCDVASGAVCNDEIGTYSCRCPEGTEGDGFRLIPRLKPDGKGGFDGRSE
ncbi:hypothetical protein ACHAXS_006879, partial [Conticribra weissflogii]